MNKKPKGNKDIINEDEIDLREIFRVFVKRKWWFIGIFIVVLIAGLLFTFLKTQEYTSTRQRLIELNLDQAGSVLSTSLAQTVFPEIGLKPSSLMIPAINID